MDAAAIDEVDVVVIGSGIGGLCAAAMLAKSGRSVAVLEAHNVPGGAAHHWARGGYQFDSGAALFSAINPIRSGTDSVCPIVSANPLSSVLAAVDEHVDVVDLPDSATCLIYPDGKQYRTQLASAQYTEVVRERMGASAAEEWAAFQADVAHLFESAGAVEPACVRLDNRVAQTTAFRRPGEMLRYLFGQRELIGKTFQDVVDRTVTRPDVQSIVDLIVEGTCSATASEVSASYMLRAFAEMWTPGTQLQYPKGGSQGIVTALLRGIGKFGGYLGLRCPVERVYTSQTDPSVASSVVLRGGRQIKVRETVISNASVWDTERILEDGMALPDFRDYAAALEMNESMLHLHVGFRKREGEDLPMHTYFLENEHTGSNGWPTIVMPTVPDPDLAPAGHHVLHATMTEPYARWGELDRTSVEYADLKKERSELLMQLVRQVVPDVDDRITMRYVGTPQSHARFLHRIRGTYGPKNLLTMAGAMPKAVKPLKNMYCCGDSVFPGVGTPAAAASGMWVANTVMPVHDHEAILSDLGL